jgi:hypothetical protein
MINQNDGYQNEGGEPFGIATITQPDPMKALVIPTPFDCAAEAEHLSKLCQAEEDPAARQAIAFQIVDLLNSGRLDESYTVTYKDQHDNFDGAIRCE